MTSHSPPVEGLLQPEPAGRRRAGRRDLRCPAHPEQRLEGNGKKYYLHLLTAEQLRERGLSHRKSRLLIDAYPVFVLSSEWLEQLFCPECASLHWCHVVKHDRVNHTVRLAPRDLWEQVAHVDSASGNTSVSQFSLREAGRKRSRRVDGKRFVG